MIEPVFGALVGLFMAAASYLLLSRSLVRVLLGLVLLGNGVNLLIFVAGRMTRAAPPIIGAGAETLSGAAANPLPQALILTAIVIGFAMFAFFSVLAFRAYQELDADHSDRMRVAEPEGQPDPPLEY